MRLSLLLSLACCALAATTPIEKRQDITSLSNGDASILDLALYLEHLEYALYNGGCDSFTDADYTAAGFPSGFRTQVCLTAEVFHRFAEESFLC